MSAEPQIDYAEDERGMLADYQHQQDLDRERVELENAVETVCKYLEFTGYTALAVAVRLALGIAPPDTEKHDEYDEQDQNLPF